MKWQLADGTLVYLKGRVTGSGELADELRADVRRVRAGIAVSVTLDLQHMTALDLTDEHLVDAWVRTVASRHQVAIDEAPELPVMAARWVSARDEPPDAIH